MALAKSKITADKAVALGKQRSYHELVEYLDAHWSVARPTSLDRMRQLDTALGAVSSQLTAVLVAGTKGKSMTIHFAAKLLREEGVSVGTYYAPHILTYGERFAVNQEQISNKVFTDIGNEVVNAAEHLGFECHSSELLALMAMRYFVEQKVDVALFEVATDDPYDPVALCRPRILTVTRVTERLVSQQAGDLVNTMNDLIALAGAGTYVVAGDQSKAHLQAMHQYTLQRGAIWTMPIRKLAALAYPFEQLHGRCAALAERIAQIYVNNVVNRATVMLSGALLSKAKGTRGRPTLEAKRYAELNPQKTIEQFWKETSNELPARFQLFDKEKPSILLDTASTVDAIENLLLGVRLLHYQRSLKGLTIIMGAEAHALHCEPFVKMLRYFFKKMSGQLLICPMPTQVPGLEEGASWDAQTVANDIKSLKVKARACASLAEALEIAKKAVDERHGLVVVTGSQAIVHEYWKNKGIKRF